MTQLNNIKKIKSFVNSKENFDIFDKTVTSFLEKLSDALLKNPKNYPEIISFAFWCRNSNLNYLKQKYIKKNFQRPRGLVFHVAPSNVSITFAYSFVISILFGNSNIVRVGHKQNPVSKFFLDTYNDLVKLKRFKKIKKSNFFLFYPRNSFLSEEISKLCDARMIWGGDETIQSFKKFQTKSRCVDMMFGDRYSISILKLNGKVNLNDVVKKYYNDIYIMNQNACTSPHFVIWYKTRGDMIKKFWDTFYELIKKKSKLKINSILDKLSKNLNNLIDFEDIKLFKNYNYELCIYNFENLKQNFNNPKGINGLIYQKKVNNLNLLKEIVTDKFQTVTYCGSLSDKIFDQIKKQNLSGIDRIVPIGDSLNMELIWDGYNLQSYLTRSVEIKYEKK